jgi:hypothetical protein
MHYFNKTKRIAKPGYYGGILVKRQTLKCQNRRGYFKNVSTLPQRNIFRFFFPHKTLTFSLKKMYILARLILRVITSL